MINLLSKLFIKNRTDYDDIRVRGQYGVLTGAVGIFLNLVLFGFKLAVGTLGRSVAITADAFNNLSDAGSSVITMIGFRLAGQKPDTEHPFGHGRFEYIAGLLVSAAIVLMGFELLKTSVGRIIHPEETEFSVLTLIVLVCSIAVKLYMALYNTRLGKKIESPALAATAKDSLSDSAATSAVLAASLIGHFTGVRLDGWCGALVSVFVLYSGISSARETIAPLLGSRPDEEYVKNIERLVTSFDGIEGIHDLIIHDYGPGRRIVSLHAEVPMRPGDDVFAVHDVIDNAERKLREELGCDATIHLDPVAAGDERAAELKAEMQAVLQSIDPSLMLHDFRIVPGPTHTNMIFDVVVPFDLPLTPDEVTERIEKAASCLEGGKYYAVVTVDRPFC
ncbi:MAG: cation transporter [Clostridia bacterium]|nr:cation transporter [Clostridia bacterium]